MDRWRLIRSGRRDGPYNMAVDEAIFISLKAGASPPTIRFYGFEPPCLSLGYFQRVEGEIDLEACHRLGIQLVRRPTGGRAVLHDGELTYSVIARYDGRIFPKDLLATYRKISSCILKGFEILGLRGELTTLREKRVRPAHHSSPNCFASPSWYEVTIGGKKVVGSAQKRDRSFFLQHGSILIDLSPDKYRAVFRLPYDGYEQFTCINDHLGGIDFDHLEQALTRGFQEEMEVELVEGPLGPQEEALVKRLLEERYLKEEWK